VRDEEKKNCLNREQKVCSGKKRGERRREKCFVGKNPIIATAHRPERGRASEARSLYVRLRTAGACLTYSIRYSW
jgi:hypothetical protein